MTTEKQYRTLSERLGERLRSARENNRYSMGEVSEKCGMSKAHLWQIETGKTQNAGIGIVYRLARLYGVSIDWLVREDAV